MVKKGTIAIKKGTPFPLGASKKENGTQFAVYAPDFDEIKVHFYKLGKKQPDFSLELGLEYKIAHVFSVIVEEKDLEGMEYTFEIGGKEIADIYARKITGMEKWSVRTKKEEELGIRSVVYTKEKEDKTKELEYREDFNQLWEEDKNPRLSFSDVILYQLHVRGFTKHSSSKIEEKGTFKGIERKIPYLKDLGITSLLLLPVYEFDEVMKEDLYEVTKKHLEQYKEVKAVQETEQLLNTEYAEIQKEKRVNYWGYSDNSWYFAPKKSYAFDRQSPERELKELIMALHKEQMELILDIYFPENTSADLMIECLRFWVLEYHVDGFRVNDNVVPSDIIVKDPVIGSVKLFANGWNEYRLPKMKKGQEKSVAEFNDGFMNDMRCFLKGDEGMVSAFFYRTRRNPTKVAVINYMANNNSFTLHDLVSYNTKHNEENGENERDGSDWNCSWNCGIEGKTRKKQILELRKKQMKNAMLMLFLSQGTPMLLSGDEFGDTREGNNNPYCQDNEISWINWDLQKRNAEHFSFVKELIAFRKVHRILHMKKEFRMSDYASFGYPDLSFHGTKAWYPDDNSHNRMAAVMLAGKYVGRVEEQEDNDFYIAYNMHWEKQEFGLPKLDNQMQWEVLIDTGRKNIEKQPLEKMYLMQPRSVALLVAVKREEIIVEQEIDKLQEAKELQEQKISKLQETKKLEEQEINVLQEMQKIEETEQIKKDKKTKKANKKRKRKK